MRHLLLTVLLAVSFNASAAIVDLGNITRDTSSGLDWLDLTETRGLSYNEVTAELGAGGALEGWRYATMAEWEQLVSNFGYVAQTPGCGNGIGFCDIHMPGENLLIEDMINMLGDTYQVQFYEYIAEGLDTPYGFAADGAGYAAGLLDSHTDGGASAYDRALIYDMERIYRETGAAYHDDGDRVMSAFDSFGADLAAGNTGSYLVRTAVPIPAAAWLFASGLGLLGWMRRRA